jgi:hypothetical protein
LNFKGTKFLATPMPKRTSLLKQAESQIRLLILKYAQVVDLKCISDDHEKRSKLFKSYEFRKTGRFDEGDQLKKCPEKCASCTNFWALR